MQRVLSRGPQFLTLAPALLLAACGTASTLERADDANTSAFKRETKSESTAFAPPPEGAATAGELQPAEQSGEARPAAPPRVMMNEEAAPARAPRAMASKGQADAHGDDSRGPASDELAMKAPTREREVRPGLGTTWGETRTSHISQVSFERQAFMNPSEIFKLFYNDESGILAQTGESSLAAFESNYTASKNGFVSVEIVDPDGIALPGLSRGGKTYVAGTDGERYGIRVRNHGQYRYEVVATVDGLDVIDGTKGNFAKRGYILDSYGTLLIEGFRQSKSAVAAFRFGSVADSYAARTQSDRNVGVVGVAVFAERGAIPEYTDREIQKRESADPFPGQFARPPQPAPQPRPRRPYLVE
ncbi:MAG: hypothetical protein QM784_26640 [Polyangiaceae bacterium]